MKPVRVGVLGCGYWGPNHIRNFSSLRGDGVEMAVAADRDEGRRNRIGGLYPWVRLEIEADTVLDDPEIDAVVIATPVSTHYPFAKKALEAGKHVLVEKPFVTSSEQANELCKLAESKGLTILVGHTFEYTAAVNRIREIVANGELGEVLYIRSLRVNLGLFQKDINVIWDLAPHDISILLYALQQMPVSVSAVGSAHVTKGIEDVAVITLQFGETLMANVVVSWLDPRKVREITIVGNQKMLVYDDVSPNEKVRIYDKGVEGPSHYDSFGEFQYSYRYGDIVTPMLNEQEPLGVECRHFIACIRGEEQPRSSGRVGANVVRILEAANESLKQDGARIKLD
jgi:predicted dehydrogenase